MMRNWERHGIPAWSSEWRWSSSQQYLTTGTNCNGYRQKCMNFHVNSRKYLLTCADQTLEQVAQRVCGVSVWIFKTWLGTVLDKVPWLVLPEREVGPADLKRSLQFQWFCDSIFPFYPISPRLVLTLFIFLWVKVTQ